MVRWDEWIHRHTHTKFVGVVSETHFANRFREEEREEKTRASKRKKKLQEKRKEGEKIVSE